MFRTRTPLAIVLAAAAVAAPSASALIPHEGGQVPDPDAALSARSSGLNQKYGLGSGSSPAATVPRTPPDRIDGASAIATPPPVAVVPRTPPDRMDATPAAATSSASTRPIVRMDGQLPATQVQPRPIVAATGSDFDWSAAGIGFAAAAGLALLGSGSLMTVRWRRQVRTPAH